MVETESQHIATVRLEVVDAAGQPLSSISVGEQFAQRAILESQMYRPFSGFADLRFSNALVSPVTDPANVGLKFSNTSAGLIDEAGRILYGTDSAVIFSQTFTATKKGLATFATDAADVFGHEITVLGLNEVLPWSQITFGSTTLEIKGR